jgi:hypothetical protein
MATINPTPDGAPPLAQPSKPGLALPAFACDAHCHIFGPFDRFPAAGRSQLHAARSAGNGAPPPA